MMPPDLSIVIVSWNTRDLLRDCLASLPAAAPGLEAQTIVVDNGSRDGSPEMVREEFPDVDLVEAGANLGFSRGNNLAFGRARGEAVLLLNPDTVCPPDSLRLLLGRLRAEPRAGAVGPTLVDSAGRPTLSWGRRPGLRWHLLELLGPTGSPLRRLLGNESFVVIPPEDAQIRDVPYLMGACLMIRREALEQVGPLDERFFMYFEETDWCLRAAAAGWRILHVGEARVAHLEGEAAARAGDFAIAQFQHSYRLFLRKHGRGGAIPALRAVQFVEYGLKWLFRSALARLDPRGAERHAAMAANFRRRAAIQLRGAIEPAPPA